MTVSFILRPGVGLMRRLRFSAKLALLGGVAVLALLAVAGVQGWGPRATWGVCGVACPPQKLPFSPFRRFSPPPIRHKRPWRGWPRLRSAT